MAQMLQSKGGMTRLTIFLCAAFALIGSGAALADVLVTTDQERLEAFAQSVTGKVSAHRIDAALQYTDTATVSVDVVGPNKTRTFDVDNDSDLTAYVHDMLAPLSGDKFKLIQQTVSVQGKRGIVSLRVRTEKGLVNTTFKLERVEDRWLVRRMTIS